MEKVFAAIDLKSFYASVECHELGLNPLTTNLVVANPARTDKTICLAISPSLKSYGLPGRARLFEVNQKVATINALRLKNSPLGVFLGRSSNDLELKSNPSLALDFIIAPPRMQYYLNYSSKIYNLYLHYVAPEDIFAYSIDEVFCDITSYLKSSHSTPTEFVSRILNTIYQETGITATAGIGTNLYLAKVAMDILAKHAEPNNFGARLASLNENSYRELLWSHQPITDFWRVGRGYAKRLATRNLFTMGDVARCSLDHPKLLYQLFGVNAELLIDHAWGYECVNISDVKHHQPRTKSLSSSQVLAYPYSNSKARTIIKEMAEGLSLDLVKKSYLTSHLTLHVEYDHTNISQNLVPPTCITLDHYHRPVPEPTHASLRLDRPTSSTRLITESFLKIFDENSHSKLTIRKLTLATDDLVDQDIILQTPAPLTQTDLFTDYTALTRHEAAETKLLTKERQVQQAILKIRNRYGANSILRGINFEKGATGRSRHHQIGGHDA